MWTWNCGCPRAWPGFGCIYIYIYIHMDICVHVDVSCVSQVPTNTRQQSEHILDAETTRDTSRPGWEMAMSKYSIALSIFFGLTCAIERGTDGTCQNGKICTSLFPHLIYLPRLSKMLPIPFHHKQDQPSPLFSSPLLSSPSCLNPGPLGNSQNGAGEREKKHLLRLLLTLIHPALFAVRPEGGGERRRRRQPKQTARRIKRPAVVVQQRPAYIPCRNNKSAKYI